MRGYPLCDTPMEIYQLRTFLTVARLGHVTRAAERLNLTQSAVSKQIKAFEDELGIVLFARSRTGVALTKAGAALVDKAQATLDSAVDLLNAASALRSELAGVVRLGTIIDPEFIRLGDLLGRMLAEHPLIDFRLTHGISGWVLDQIESQALDAGFYLGRLRSPQVRALELTTLTYVVAAPADWEERWRDRRNERSSSNAWLQSDPLQLLAQLPWIRTPAHSSQNRLVRELLEPTRREIEFTVEADQEASMMELVRRGLGLCMMREDLATTAAARGDITIWPRIRQLCPLSFIYPAALAESPLINALLEALRAIWQLDAAAPPPDTPLPGPG